MALPGAREGANQEAANGPKGRKGSEGQPGAICLGRTAFGQKRWERVRLTTLDVLLPDDRCGPALNRLKSGATLGWFHVVPGLS
jgi:hypothetical protein